MTLMKFVVRRRNAKDGQIDSVSAAQLEGDSTVVTVHPGSTKEIWKQLSRHLNGNTAGGYRSRPS